MLKMASLAGKLDLVLLGGGILSKNHNVTDNDNFKLVGKFLIADLVKFGNSSFDCNTGSVKKGDQCGRHNEHLNERCVQGICFTS